MEKKDDNSSPKDVIKDHYVQPHLRWCKIMGRLAKTLSWLGTFLTLAIVCITLGEPKITVDYAAQYWDSFDSADEVQDNNAAVYFEKAIDVFHELDKKYGKLSKIDFGRVTESQRTDITHWVNENEEALTLFARGAECDYYVRVRDSGDESLVDVANSFPELKVSHVARAMQWRAYLKACEGDHRGAAADIVILTKAAAHFEYEYAFVMEQLAALNVRKMAFDVVNVVIWQGLYDESVLRLLHDELADVCVRSVGNVALEVERLLLLDMIQHCFTERLIYDHIYFRYASMVLRDRPEMESSFWRVPYAVWDIITCPDKQATQVDAENFYHKMAEMMRYCPYEIKYEQKELQDNIESILEKNPFIRSNSWSFSLFNPFMHRGWVHNEAVLAVVSAHLYRYDTGGFPEDLPALVEAGYLLEEPRDPFAAGAMQYRRDGEGFILYSVWKDFVDNGGFPNYKELREQAEREGKEFEDGQDADRIYWPVR